MNLLDYIVDKLNINAGVEFRTNFVLDFTQAGYDSVFTLQRVDGDKIEMDNVSFCPASEVVTQNTPFVENNKRDAWVKTIAFPLKIVNGYQFDKDDLYYQALIDLRNEMNGALGTIDNKKASFKVSYPRYDRRSLSGGNWYAIFVVDFFITTIEQGYFCNEYDIEIKKTTDVDYHKVDYTEFSLPVGADTITVSNVLNDTSTKDVLSRYTTQFSLTFNYFGSEIEKELYGYQMGKGDSTITYDLRLTHQSGVYEYVVKITAGAPLWKLGTVDRISIDMKEVE